MKKIAQYISLICLLFLSCEEEYLAKIDGVENLISIQALITNKASENFVKVTKTQYFGDVPREVFVAGATVALVDEDGQTFVGTETSEGVFAIKHAALPTKKYKLLVEAEGEVYESSYELMPPIPSFDSFYVNPETAVSYKYSSTGKPVTSETTGMRAFVNVPLSDSLKYHRFEIEKALEYVLLKDTIRETIFVIDGDTIVEKMPDIMPIYSWRIDSESGLFNVVGPTGYGNEKIIKDIPLVFGGNQILDLINHDPQYRGEYLAGWIINVKQYGLNEHSYKNYRSMNEQLTASGKLFDAAYTQIQSNILCTSNTTKGVVGFFELSSFNYFRFYMKTSIGAEESVYYLTDETVYVPFRGATRWLRPIFWNE